MPGPIAPALCIPGFDLARFVHAMNDAALPVFYNDIWASAPQVGGMPMAAAGNGALTGAAQEGISLTPSDLAGTTCGVQGPGVAYTAQHASPAGAKKKKAGARATRVPVKKATVVLDWSDGMVRDLMSLRYETHAERFSRAKNNSALKEAWLPLATELSQNQKTAISSEQCKNKLKWLKRKWAEFNTDVHATGNPEVEVLEPPGLDLMQ